jgi:hypothetical protein
VLLCVRYCYGKADQDRWVSLPPQINKHQGWFWLRFYKFPRLLRKRFVNSLGLLYSDNNAHTKAQNAYEEALEIYRTLAKKYQDCWVSLPSQINKHQVWFWLRFCKFPRLLRKRFVLLCVHCCHCKAGQSFKMTTKDNDLYMLALLHR